MVLNDMMEDLASSLTPPRRLQSLGTWLGWKLSGIPGRVLSPESLESLEREG